VSFNIGGLSEIELDTKVELSTHVFVHVSRNSSAMSIRRMIQTLWVSIMSMFLQTPILM
jgi:hypothetical protein